MSTSSGKTLSNHMLGFDSSWDSTKRPKSRNRTLEGPGHHAGFHPHFETSAPEIFKPVFSPYVLIQKSEIPLANGVLIHVGLIPECDSPSALVSSWAR